MPVSSGSTLPSWSIGGAEGATRDAHKCDGDSVTEEVPLPLAADKSIAVDCRCFYFVNCLLFTAVVFSSISHWLLSRLFEIPLFLPSTSGLSIRYWIELLGLGPPSPPFCWPALRGSHVVCSIGHGISTNVLLLTNVDSFSLRGSVDTDYNNNKLCWS